MEIDEQDFNVSWAARHKFVIDHFRDAIENKVVVEYGSWNGGFLECCRVHNVPCTYYGLDIVPEMIEFDRSQFGPCGDFRLLAEDGHIPDDIPPVDTIVLLDTLEHLPAKSEGSYLSHFASRLKEGGKLVISCPHWNKWSFLDPAWYFGHRHYSEAGLHQLLEENGFQVQSCKFNGGVFGQLDTLVFYLYKHLLRRPYQSCGWMSRRLARESQAHQSGTAIYVLARKGLGRCGSYLSQSLGGRRQ